MGKTVDQALEYEHMKIKPLRRMRRSQIDRKVFRGMSDRTIVLGGLRELYVRHSVGFWQATCVLSWALILTLVLH